MVFECWGEFFTADFTPALITFKHYRPPWICTKVRRPQSNGIVERFHRTVLDEHFRVEGRRTWFETVEQMQEALDAYLLTYNTARPHQGRGMNGRTPARAFLDRIPANDNPQEDNDQNIDKTEAA